MHCVRITFNRLLQCLNESIGHPSKQLLYARFEGNDIDVDAVDLERIRDFLKLFPFLTQTLKVVLPILHTSEVLLNVSLDVQISQCGPGHVFKALLVQVSKKLLCLIVHRLQVRRVLLRHQLENLCGTYSNKLQRYRNELRDLVVVFAFKLLKRRSEFDGLIPVNQVSTDLRQRLIQRFETHLVLELKCFE